MQRGWTALIIAAMEGCQEIVDVLLKSEDININKKDRVSLSTILSVVHVVVHVHTKNICDSFAIVCVCVLIILLNVSLCVLNGMSVALIYFNINTLSLSYQFLVYSERNGSNPLCCQV